MRSWKALTRVSALIGGLVLVVATLFNATKLERVVVTLKAGAVEPTDRVVLGVGKDHAAPDYRLRVKSGDDWVDCGVYADTPIGDGLEFQVHERIPMRSAAALRLIEDDKVDDDVLEDLPITGRTVDGESYRFELRSAFDLGSGLDWFFATPLGAIVGLAIVVAIAAFAFSLLNV